MEILRPFSEQRRVISSVDVSLLQPDITSLRAESKENLRSYPLQGFEPDGKVTVTVHIRTEDTGAKYYLQFEVCVEGIPEDSDVWIVGEFSWRVRSFGDKGATFTNLPLTDCRPTWLRGNGRLRSFTFSFTQDIIGKVSVYGADEGGDKVAAAGGPAQDLRSLRQHTALCDVVLRAAGKDFPAHKIVMASRSPVILTMFTADFKEAKDKVVDIAVDCSSEVFGVFVDFFYSGSTRKMSCGDVLHLLELAERHLVDDLKVECVKQLLSVSAEDALEVLQASLEKPFVPKKCREHAFRLTRNNWQTISASEAWAKFCVAQPSFALAVECMMTVV